MKKLLVAIFSIAIALFGLATPAFADDKNCVDVSILNIDGGDQYCEDASDGGKGIEKLLQIGVNVLSVLIGVLGIVGIVVVGVQYMSSGGNEERMRKAKRRMIEIVLGLVAYVLLYALLRFLAPGF